MASSEAATHRSRLRRVPEIAGRRGRTGWVRMTAGYFQAVQMTVAAVGAYVIAELSQGMTLRPGTIISMGTPAGVGMGFDPPEWLHPGDVVACSIEGIGTLTNTVR